MKKIKDAPNKTLLQMQKQIGSVTNDKNWDTIVKDIKIQIQTDSIRSR